MPLTASTTLSGNPYVDGLLRGIQWASPALSFSFPTAGTDYNVNGQAYSYGYEPLTFTAFGAVAQAGALLALGQFAAVSGLTFTAAAAGAGIIRFGYTSTQPTTESVELAHAYYPSEDGHGGDVWIQRPYNDDPVRGLSEFRTLMHEIGHAVGLKHPFGDSSGEGGGAPMPIDRDRGEFTVMSYMRNSTFDDAGAPQTLMMYDIAALQHLYGANFATRSGDTVYRWNPAAGQMWVNGVAESLSPANRILMTVWDGGGEDSYDFSLYATDLRVDLRPGGWSITDPAQLSTMGDGEKAYGNVFNALLFGGDPRSLIENAIGGSGNDLIVGNQAANRLEGGAGADRLEGGEGGDRLLGGDGADILVGGAGADLLAGGAGADRFLYFSFAESAAGAYDRILGFESGIDVIDLAALAAGAVRWSELTDPADGSLYSLLTATSAAGELVLRVDGHVAAGDVRIDSGRSFAGTAAADDLVGSAGDDLIDGGAGADRMSGLHGDDRYFVDDAGDQVAEAVDHGTDTVLAAVSWTLGQGSEVEMLAAADPLSTAPLDLTGNGFDQRLVGNQGANRLDGGGGADVLEGGAGDDVYLVDPDDRIVEAAGQGNDLVLVSGSWTLSAGAEVETLAAADPTSTAPLDLAGNAYGQTVRGNAGANLLTGGGGADILVGLAGDDTYRIDPFDDQVVEQAGGGYDRVYVDITRIDYRIPTEFKLAAGAEVEYLALADPASRDAFDLIGNEFGQEIVGNAANNFLNGGGGADRLVGGPGSDIYRVDADDVIVELAGEGSDVALALESYVLGAGVSIEQLTAAFGTAPIALTGNELGQALWGNDGANVLRGGGGADTFLGFGGDDVIYTDGGDTIIENPDQGYDRVFTSASLVLSRSSEIEEVAVEDSAGTAAINLKGNDYAQRLVGNEGANRLEGLGGDDRLEGGGGDDLLDGGPGSDLLGGGPGGDTMIGGAGDDTYRVDQAGDVVTELAGEGTDTVETSLGSRSDFAALYYLPDNVEYLTGTSGTGQGVWGSGADNVVRMGDGGDLVVLADRSDYYAAAAGNDDVNGGGGNDFLFFGGSFSNGDKVNGGAGFDTLGLLGTYSVTFDADDL
ncbi:MAG: M10 family metallopeptidase C-terminal domain-containing protein, partial [Alphaproteobacteria bacterium]|nr:M10 family metallopeptidase C-terminal domain-containing protein [Alphaproteobacteria bacterium]